MNPPPYSGLTQQVAFVCIRAYATHSYLYYKKDMTVIGDEAFDKLCVWLLANYNWIKPYDLNDYLDKGALEAGSGFNIADKVRGLTKDYAEDLLLKHCTTRPEDAPTPQEADEDDPLGF